MRTIAVIDDFMTPLHRQQVEETATRFGFAVEFFSTDAELRGRETEFEILYGHCAPDILKASRNLKWFCCSYAGVDPYQDESVFPSPDTLLSNSSGAYGTTIAEHILMVTLMMLRRMPNFQEVVRRHGWQQSMPMRSICGSAITVLGTGDSARYSSVARWSDMSSTDDVRACGPDVYTMRDTPARVAASMALRCCPARSSKSLLETRRTTSAPANAASRLVGSL